MLLVTADDDHTYHPDWLAHLVQCHHTRSGSHSVVAARTRWMCLSEGCSQLSPFKPYVHWPVSNSDFAAHEGWGLDGSLSHHEMLLPIGTGGVLYRPAFFHPIVLNESYLAAAHLGDDISFRFATLANNVRVFKCPLADQSHTEMLKTRTNAGERGNRSLHASNTDNGGNDRLMLKTYTSS